MTRTVPRTRRRLAAAAVAVVLGVAATFGIATPAWAAIYMYHGPGSSYGMVDFDLIDDWMHLYTQSQTLATGTCLDTPALGGLLSGLRHGFSLTPAVPPRRSVDLRSVQHTLFGRMRRKP